MKGFLLKPRLSRRGIPLIAEERETCHATSRPPGGGMAVFSFSPLARFSSEIARNQATALALSDAAPHLQELPLGNHSTG